MISAAGYDNCDGGGNQQNNAHLVEMLAALSIIDFAGKQSQQNAVKILIFMSLVLKVIHKVLCLLTLALKQIT